MKNFLQYILESSDIDIIKLKLISNKYNLKDDKSKSVITVLVNKSERIQTLNDIAKEFNGEYKSTSSKSSVGETKIGNITVLAKPLTSSKGQSPGEAAEPVVAYLFNALNGNTELIDEAENIDLEILNKLKSKEYSDKWIISSKLSAQKLHNVLKDAKDFIACHVNGNDLLIIPIDIKKLACVFKSKLQAGIVLKNDRQAFNDLYNGNSKDVWNKSDILLVNKSFTIDMLDIKQLVTGADLNEKLNQLILANIIYPVSLKAISEKATEQDIQVVKEGNILLIDQLVTALDKITNVNFELPNTIVKDKKYIGSCYLKAPGFTILFRNNSTANKDVLSVELLLKNARGGKSTEVLRLKLGLVKGFYRNIRTGNTPEDFIKIIEKLLGPLSSIELAKVPSLTKQDPKWHIRTCFKGVIALAEAYRNNIQNQHTGKVDLISMFKTFYNAGSGNSSNSIFYLLSMG